MKEFQALRTELNDGVEDLTEHIAIANSSMPPNILILRRKTVRQFPNNTMVALYYNDKLGQYFSIPYGGDAGGVVTPVALKEDQDYASYLHGAGHKPEDAATLYHTRRRDLKEGEQIQELSKGLLGSYIRGAARHKDILTIRADNMRHAGPVNAKQADKLQAINFRRTKGIRTAAEKLVNKGPRSLEEGVISHLERVKAFKTSEPLRHADGTKTKIDPTTANALLTVHAALKPEHQVKFVQHLEHSKPKFHKMLDFAWKQVS